MAHITKFKLSSMAQMYAHVERKAEQTRRYGNCDIDASRTHLNYSLRAGSMQLLEARLNSVKHTHRRDLVACVGVCITLPKNMLTAHESEQKRFFDACANFLDKKFGAENCCYAQVHMDETTPHLHYGFVPVVTKLRKCRSKARAGETYAQERVCAKEVVTKEMLSSFHDELQAHILRAMPEYELKDLCLCAPAEDRKRDKSIEQLKRETAAERRSARADAIAEHQQEIADLRKTAASLKQVCLTLWKLCKSFGSRCQVTEEEHQELKRVSPLMSEQLQLVAELHPERAEPMQRGVSVVTRSRGRSR